MEVRDDLRAIVTIEALCREDDLARLVPRANSRFLEEDWNAADLKTADEDANVPFTSTFLKEKPASMGWSM